MGQVAFTDGSRNAAQAVTLLETIVKNNGGNYAQAAEIALASIKTAPKGINYAAGKIGSLLTGKLVTDQPRLPSGYVVDPERVQSNIIKARGGKFVDEAIEDQRLSDAAPKIAAAESALASAQSRVVQIQRTMARDPRAAALLPQAMSDLTAAQANYQLIQASATKPQNQYRRK